jgi:hypothetical protein
MSLPKLQATLEKRLAQSRIVFWYDAEAEWWTEFDASSVEGVEKIRKLGVGSQILTGN